MLTAVASSAIASDTCVPTQTRTKRSRPLASVPNQCPVAIDGGVDSGDSDQSTVSIPYGRIQGPMIETASSVATSRAARRAARLCASRRQVPDQSRTSAVTSRGTVFGIGGALLPASLMADPRVEPRIGEIDGEIEQHDQRRVEDHHAHDQRVVTVDRTLDEVTPDAGKTERLFDNQRPGQQRCGRRSDETDDREDRRSEGVPPQQSTTTDALGTGRADEW